MAFVRFPAGESQDRTVRRFYRTFSLTAPGREFDCYLGFPVDWSAVVPFVQSSSWFAGGLTDMRIRSQACEMSLFYTFDNTV